MPAWCRRVSATIAVVSGASQNRILVDFGILLPKGRPVVAPRLGCCVWESESYPCAQANGRGTLHLHVYQRASRAVDLDCGCRYPDCNPHRSTPSKGRGSSANGSADIDRSMRGQPGAVKSLTRVPTPRPTATGFTYALVPGSSPGCTVAIPKERRYKWRN